MHRTSFCFLIHSAHLCLLTGASDLFNFNTDLFGLNLPSHVFLLCRTFFMLLLSLLPSLGLDACSLERLLLSSFYKWANQGTEKLITLFKVTYEGHNGPGLFLH